MSKFNPLEHKRILLQVTGSIAAFKAAALCSKLVQAGYEVEVVLSKGAEKFIGAASFEGLTRKPVHRGLYDEGKMMAHIDLERWADLILLYPTSANTISALAQGRSDSLIGSIFLAHEFKKPYWIAPAMNQAMWAHPATQQNIEQLQKWGVTVDQPDAGSLACGEIGKGRLIEPETMLAKIDAYFANVKTKSAPQKLTAAKKIIITSGGTTEPIDDVRSITNFSTGQTGYSLALSLAQQGHEVTLLQSRLSHFQLKSEPQTHALNYITTTEFTDELKKELENKNYDVIIHAAAVADYHVEKTSGKIQGASQLSLNLIPNEKVLKSVRKWSKNAEIEVISFKLTAEGEHGKSNLKLETYDSEWIVHNELKDVQGQAHGGTIYQREKGAYAARLSFKSKHELNHQIFKIISKESL